MSKKRSIKGQSVFLGTMVFGSIALLVFILINHEPDTTIKPPRSQAIQLAVNATANAQTQPRTGPLKLSDIPIDGERAYGYLKKMCDMGPRFSGSPGMAMQQKWLRDHFTKLGAKVEFQEFQARHPITGDAVKMANIIIQWHPEKRHRVMLCAHYDTRPFPDEDKVNRKGVFLGANDGASGVAVLCELGNHMKELKTPYGIDFVLFDAEELIYGIRGKFFLGSEHVARRYVSEPPPDKYRAAVLLDMVGDKNLDIYREVNSYRWAESRPMVDDIWATARDLGVREFKHSTKYTIKDDHLALYRIAKIPACDIIDFNYRRPGTRVNYWHTTQDTPERCSALSLAKVGWVVHTWLGRLQ